MNDMIGFDTKKVSKNQRQKVRFIVNNNISKIWFDIFYHRKYPNPLYDEGETLFEIDSNKEQRAIFVNSSATNAPLRKYYVIIL